MFVCQVTWFEGRMCWCSCVNADPMSIPQMFLFTYSSHTYINMTQYPYCWIENDKDNKHQMWTSLWASPNGRRTILMKEIEWKHNKSIFWHKGGNSKACTRVSGSNVTIDCYGRHKMCHISVTKFMFSEEHIMSNEQFLSAAGGKSVQLRSNM